VAVAAGGIVSAHSPKCLHFVGFLLTDSTP